MSSRGDDGGLIMTGGETDCAALYSHLRRASQAAPLDGIVVVNGIGPTVGRPLVRVAHACSAPGAVHTEST